jgi:hypothetical protein
VCLFFATPRDVHDHVAHNGSRDHYQDYDQHELSDWLQFAVYILTTHAELRRSGSILGSFLNVLLRMFIEGMTSVQQS